MDIQKLYYPLKINSKDEIKEINILYKLEDTHYILCCCSKLFYSTNYSPSVIRSRFIKHNDSKHKFVANYLSIDEIKLALKLISNNNIDNV
jgi:hypothetical protein